MANGTSRPQEAPSEQDALSGHRAHVVGGAGMVDALGKKIICCTPPALREQVAAEINVEIVGMVADCNDMLGSLKRIAAAHNVEL